ncbi:MAG: NAD(P)H-dependent oxidoreductase [Bacteroidota bacterium]|nr:NAD(P)H-dependent oxidoreductase [Bacteroidota bacterium]
MKKNILIINGHPDKDSLCYELAKRYQIGTEKSNTIAKLINLVDLEFTPILKHGYNKRTELEPDLVNIQTEINKADHLVFVYPNWWGTYPALLKGFIDRVFLPKFAFEYQEESPFPKKLLNGKTARLIVTMDTPTWYYSLFYRKPGHNSMRKSILHFCGVKPVKISAFGPVKSSNDEKQKNWLDKVEKLGESMK